MKARQELIRLVGNLSFVALALVFLCGWSSGQTRTLVFDSGDDVDKVSFDPAKISEAKVREDIIFSPFIVSYFNNQPSRDFTAAGYRDGKVVNKVFIALPLELCLTTDVAYVDCKMNDVTRPNFLRNAKVNLAKTGAGIERLRSGDYPRELEPVRQFLTAGLEFSLWIEETRFKYYSTWNEGILQNVHGDIEPAQLCPNVFRKLAASSSEQEKYDVVRFEWANCMVAAGNKKFGLYPVESWNYFLKTFGIKEDFVDRGPD